MGTIIPMSFSEKDEEPGAERGSGFNGQLVHHRTTLENRERSPKIEPSDVLGSIGVGLILIAFILNLAGTMDRLARSYLVLNLVGASLTLLASAIIEFYPFVVLESVWALAALIGLLRGQSEPKIA